MKKTILIAFFAVLAAIPAARAQLALTEIMTQEANTSNNIALPSTIKYPDWFEISNFGTNDINLTGYRWNDDSHSGALAADFAAFNGVIIHAGEAIALVESNNVITSPTAFRQWWGISAGVQVILLSGSDPGLGGTGDSVRLWGPGSASATEQFDVNDLVDRVDTGNSLNGRSQLYNTNNGTFSIQATNGATGSFIAAFTDDVGSPGILPSPSPIVITQQPSPTNYTSPAGVPLILTVKGFGLPKPRFQWLLNGSPIDTNAAVAGIINSITNNQAVSTLIFTSVQTNNSGTYSVIADNGVQTLICSNTVITVTANASAPTIITPPRSLNAYLGQVIHFTVDAAASPSPTFQWKFNGTNLSGKTSPQLVLSLTDTNQSGTYSVGITNSQGFTNASATLLITPKPNLRITEIMPTENPGGSHGDWWELSNLDTFGVKLQGYRFDDSSFSFSEALTVTNDITIAPGESVIFAEDMTPAQFRKWWGPDHLLPNLQVVTYHGGGIGLSGTVGDTLEVWNAAAEVENDYLDAAGFDVQTNAISFGFDPETLTFGAETVDGINGGIHAAVNGDLGSPGTIVNLPRFTTIAKTNSGIALAWVSQPNRHYVVQANGTLGNTNWTTLTNALPSDANLLQFVDPANVSTQRFYRVILNP